MQSNVVKMACEKVMEEGTQGNESSAAFINDIQPHTHTHYLSISLKLCTLYIISLAYIFLNSSGNQTKLKILKPRKVG